MVIASIAMDELALSHILNAEGEKLQYILGTLPGGPGSCANTQEILEVNKSVKDLLDTVMENQMLLKGKLEKALEAGGHKPNPCGPDCPEQPPCAAPCCQKSAIQLLSRCRGFVWGGDTSMSWKCQGQKGCGISWDEKTPAQVRLESGKAYTLNFTVNTCGSLPGGGTGSVSVKLTPCGAFWDILPFHFSLKCLECKPLTLHYSAMLLPRACPSSCAGLSLHLDDKSSLFVDQATLSIAEI